MDGAFGRRFCLYRPPWLWRCIPAANKTSAMAARSKPAASAGPPSRLQGELARRILRHLKDQGAQPGHHLVELELCRAFGVSRTPIRGALQLLAAQGVLTARAGRGFALGKMPAAAADDETDSEEEDDQRLFGALAQAR